MNDKIAFRLCLFGGYVGAHKFYKREWGKGILYLFTLGLFFVGWIKDIIELYKIANDIPPSERQLRKQREKEEAIALREQQLLEEQQRVATMDREGTAYCPKCKSTSITAQKKGFGMGKAAVGAVAIGAWGLAAGGLGKNKIEITCLKCGYRWKAGKR